MSFTEAELRYWKFGERDQVVLQGMLVDGDRSNGLRGAGRVQVVRVKNQHVLRMAGIKILNAFAHRLTVFLTRRSPAPNEEGNRPPVESLDMWPVALDVGMDGQLCGLCLDMSCEQVLLMSSPEHFAGLVIAKPADAMPVTERAVVHCWAALHSFEPPEPEGERGERHAAARARREEIERQRLQGQRRERVELDVLDVRRRARAAFKTFDADGSGTIDFEGPPSPARSAVQ